MELNLREEECTNEDPKIELIMAGDGQNWPENAEEELTVLCRKIDTKTQKNLSKVYGM